MKNTYQIQAKVSFYDEVEVEAENQEEAIKKAKSKIMEENALIDGSGISITEIREDFI